MSLTKLYIDINHVKFAERDYIENHVLYLNREGIIQRLADKRFKSLELELAFPGEKVRIVSVGDIIQPMFKLDDERNTFSGMMADVIPGINETIRPLGTGRSLMLRGVCVTETYESLKGNGLYLDMYGEGARHTIFGGKIHVVIVAVPREGVELFAYMEALKAASLKLSVYLAGLARELTPDEIYEWSWNKGSFEDDTGKPLPRVAYAMYNCNLAPLQTTRFYAHEALEAFPTIIEPMEILDGALVTFNHDQVVNATATWTYQNHPLIEQLLKRHGKDLNFVGLIMCSVNFTMNNKIRNAMIATSLAKNVLAADIVLITKESGGHPQIDCATLCEMCEKQGIQVAMIQSEFGANSFGAYESLIFNSPYAKAIVSAGCLNYYQSDKPERVIGHNISWPPFDTPLTEEITGVNWRLKGGLNQIGESYDGSFWF